MQETELTMYLIVNSSLKMRKGKIAGQVGHAVGLMVDHLVRTSDENYNIWRSSLYKKIVLKATKEQFEEVSNIKGSYKVVDAGRTQIPSGSETVIGFHPMFRKEVPEILKSLKLL
jgi:PTH2 family peptidyl-tRNA hydrolase